MSKKFVKKSIVLSIVLTTMMTTSLFAFIPIKIDNSSSFNANGNSGYYLGVQAGYADMNYTKSWLSDDPDITSVGEVDDSGFSGRLFGGYNFNPYFAFELGYVFLPKVKFNDITVRGGTNTVNESFRQSIVDFLLKSTLPLTDGFDLYAKTGFAGVQRDDLEATSGGVTVKSNTTNTKTVPALGAGTSYHIDKNNIIDLSYIRYFGNGDLEPTDFVSLGYIYQFS